MSRPHGRRSFLRWAAAAAGAAALPAAFTLRPRARAMPSEDQRFLFVITATGGGSIIDSFLPIAASEAGEAADRVVAYPDAVISQPSGSNLRVVQNLGIPGLFSYGYDTTELVRKHHADMAVVAVENTSVNHVVAQKRAITGAGIDGGRTLMEAMAMAHGDGLLLPNVNLASGGFAEPGDDGDVPTEARSEVVADPVLYALSTHGYEGLPRRPDADAIAQARGVRARFDDASGFATQHAESPLRRRYLSLRDQLLPRLEEEDLIHRLLLLRSTPELPLADFGLGLAPEQEALLLRLEQLFPNLAADKLQSQAALGFLLMRAGLSTAVTLGPSFAPNFLEGADAIPDTPIAFDYSHTDHITAQNVMWSRISETVDGLVTLLKETPQGEGSMWDQSLIYIATDFGRSKERPPGSFAFGSGHDLNNGNLFLSPLLRGNRVYGGVDATTGRTFGFDPATGEADPERLVREGHLYSLVCQAMGIDFPGRLDMSGLLRG